MFQSCSGPECHWEIGDIDDGQRLYDFGTHPHSWPQFYQSGAMSPPGLPGPYSGAYARAQTYEWWHFENTRKVGGYNRTLQYSFYCTKQHQIFLFYFRDQNKKGVTKVWHVPWYIKQDYKCFES